MKTREEYYDFSNDRSCNETLQHPQQVSVDSIMAVIECTTNYAGKSSVINPLSRFMRVRIWLFATKPKIHIE